MRRLPSILSQASSSWRFTAEELTPLSSIFADFAVGRLHESDGPLRFAHFGTLAPNAAPHIGDRAVEGGAHIDTAAIDATLNSETNGALAAASAHDDDDAPDGLQAPARIVLEFADSVGGAAAFEQCVGKEHLASLTLAVANGDVILLKQVLQQCAPQLKHDMPWVVDERENSLFHLAASHNRADVISVIASVASNSRLGHQSAAARAIDRPNAAGHTPLMTAAIYGAEEVVELLLSGHNGAVNVNSRTQQGATALHFAVEGHFTSLAMKLVEAGASLTARAAVALAPTTSSLTHEERVIAETFGVTPLQLARFVHPPSIESFVAAVTTAAFVDGVDARAAAKRILSDKVVKVIAGALLDEEKSDTSYSLDKQIEIRGGYIDATAVEGFARAIGYNDLTGADVAAIMTELESRSEALCQVQTAKRDTAPVAVGIAGFCVGCAAPEVSPTSSQVFFIDTLVDIARDRGSSAAIAHLLATSASSVLPSETRDFISDGVVAFVVPAEKLSVLQRIFTANNPEDIVVAAAGHHLAFLPKAGSAKSASPAPLAQSHTRVLVFARKEFAASSNTVHYLFLQEHQPAAGALGSPVPVVESGPHLRLTFATNTFVMARQLIASGVGVASVDEAATFALMCHSAITFKALMSHGQDALNFELVLDEFRRCILPLTTAAHFNGRRLGLLNASLVTKSDHVMRAVTHLVNYPFALGNLIAAARWGSQQAVQTILPHVIDFVNDIDADETGETPLTAAILGANQVAMRSLVQLRAGLDRCNSLTQMTPLVLAALSGNETATILLLSAGADPSLPCGASAVTPLIASLLGPNPRIAGQLLVAGARAQVADANGLTPILAAKYFSPSNSHQLLLHDARVADGCVVVSSWSSSSSPSDATASCVVPPLHTAAAALHSMQVHFHSVALRHQLELPESTAQPFTACDVEIPHPSEDAPCNLRRELLALIGALLHEAGRVLRMLLLQPHIEGDYNGGSHTAPLNVLARTLHRALTEMQAAPPMARDTEGTLALVQLLQSALRVSQVAALVHACRTEEERGRLRATLPDADWETWDAAANNSCAVRTVSTQAILAHIHDTLGLPMTDFEASAVASLLDPTASGTTSMVEYAAAARALGGFQHAALEAFCVTCAAGGVWLGLPDVACQALLFDRVPGHFCISVGLGACSIFFNDQRRNMRVRRFCSVLDAFAERREMHQLRVPRGAPHITPSVAVSSSEGIASPL